LDSRAASSRPSGSPKTKAKAKVKIKAMGARRV